MNDDIDRGADVAILMEQKINEKVARALLDVLWPDDHGYMDEVSMAFEYGDGHFISDTVVASIIHRLVNNPTFKQNVEFMVQSAMRDYLVRERGDMLRYQMINPQSEAQNAIRQQAKTLPSRVQASKGKG